MLKDLPKEDLPRERLISLGAKSLSNEELISIILRTGTKGESVKSLSEKILKEFKDITDLKDLSVGRLKKLKGLGTVKSVTLLAALELGRRVYDTPSVNQTLKVASSIDAYRYFAKYICHEKQENFLVIYLDSQKKYLSHKILFKGTLNSSIVHPREIFKEAFLESAAGIILMHNHPSGLLTPSPEDDLSTRSIIEAGNIMGIQVLDHIIVSATDYYSYLEEGKIAYE